MTAPWPMIRLGEVLRLRDSSVPASQLTDVNLAGVYSFGRGLFKRGPMSPRDTSYKSYNRLVADDFVISMPKAWEGALARVSPEFDGWFLSPVFPTFRADRTRLDPAFLEWFCRREPVWAQLQRKSRGIGARRETVSPEQFLSLDFPLPSLAEQRRIVARIEALAAEIAHARELRNQAAEDAEALWTSVLSWRFSSGQETCDTLGATCAKIIDNLHATPRYDGDDYPCIRSQDVGWGTINYHSALRTSKSEFEERTRRGEPAAGDIVFVREGDVGRCAVLDGSQRISLGQRVMMFRPGKRLEPRFLMHQFMSRPVLDDQILIGKTGTTSHHVNIKHLRGVRIVVPPLSDQRRIVAELDAIQAQVDALKRLQAETAAELDALLSAILDKAFKGDL